MKFLKSLFFILAFSAFGEAHGMSNLQYSALEFAGIVTTSAVFTYLHRDFEIFSTYKHNAYAAMEESFANGQRCDDKVYDIIAETPSLRRNTKENLAAFVSFNIAFSSSFVSSKLLIDHCLTSHTPSSFFLPLALALSSVTFIKYHIDAEQRRESPTKTLKYATLKAGKVAIIGVVGLFALEKITNLKLA